MVETPGTSPGSPSCAPDTIPAYGKPWIALLLAACGFACTLMILIGYPGLRAGWQRVPGWALSALDLVVICLPLVVAVLAAGLAASTIGVARATGIRYWRWKDLAYGLGVGLVVRAIVEVFAPTTGTLGGPLGAPPLSTSVVVVAGIVLISPYIEEWFFRGLVLRAVLDALSRFGREVAAVAAIVVSTAMFASLHFVTLGGQVPLGLALGTIGVGIGCGILTVLTGRLGAAIVAHVVFNAIGVALLVV